MTGNKIRRKFIDYFVAQSHRHVRSSSFVSASDPTLRFTNTRMNHFKDAFLGREHKREVEELSVELLAEEG